MQYISKDKSISHIATPCRSFVTPHSTAIPHNRTEQICTNVLPRSCPCHLYLVAYLSDFRDFLQLHRFFYKPRASPGIDLLVAKNVMRLLSHADMTCFTKTHNWREIPPILGRGMRWNAPSDLRNAAPCPLARASHSYFEPSIYILATDSAILYWDLVPVPT